MSHTNVRSEWVSGNLVFYDKSSNIIVTFDGANRSLVVPSGAVLTVNGVDLSTTELGLLDGVTAGTALASKVLTSSAAMVTTMVVTSDISATIMALL